MQLQYTKSHHNAQIHSPQKPGDAGFDLCLVEDVVIGNETQIIDSHIAVVIPEGYVGLLFLRSSAGIKKHLRLANHVGIIDEGFRSTIKFALYFEPQDEQTKNCYMKQGERICQLVIVPYASLQLQLVDKLPDSERGTNGIGSTG